MNLADVLEWYDSLKLSVVVDLVVTEDTHRSLQLQRPSESFEHSFFDNVCYAKFTGDWKQLTDDVVYIDGIDNAGDHIQAFVDISNSDMTRISVAPFEEVLDED
jgi:hypothetical protein